MKKPALKGVFTKNPTRSVMKSNGRQAMTARVTDVPGFKKVKPVKPKMAMKRKTK
jgi:hypothetical protein